MMPRLEAHMGALNIGLESAMLSMEAARQSAAALRDAAETGTDAKADFRFAGEKIEEALGTLADACDRMSLNVSARCANLKKLGTE